MVGIPYAMRLGTLNPDGSRNAPTGAPVEWVEESNHFFKLSEWGDRLLKFYDDNPNFIAPLSRRNEVISFVTRGLSDLSISRSSFSWGITVPDCPSHTIYVWLDALTSYLSVIGYATNSVEFNKWWPAALHVVGKDILRFHAIYWPAFLMAADLPLPKRLFAHGWWTVSNQKISKSIGNTIDPNKLIDEYGLDQTRYFLTREIRFGQDGDFNFTAMTRRINSDLVNDLGNLAMRILSQIAKNCDSIVPNPTMLTNDDNEFLAAANAVYGAMITAFDKQDISYAIERIWEVIAQTNGYIAKQQPWSLIKDNPERMGTILWVGAEILRKIALFTFPLMPNKSALLLKQLGQENSPQNYLALTQPLAAGIKLPLPEQLFPRIIG